MGLRGCHRYGLSRRCVSFWLSIDNPIKNFQKKGFLERLFGLFIILSYSWTKSAHSPLFSSLAALVGPQSGIFKFFKNAFCLFLDLSTYAVVFFLTKSALLPCSLLSLEAENAA